MYKELTINELKNLLVEEQNRYSEFKAMNLKLDMSRGKPCKEQLDLSMDMLDGINSKSNFMRTLSLICCVMSTDTGIMLKAPSSRF